MTVCIFSENPWKCPICTIKEDESLSNDSTAQYGLDVFWRGLRLLGKRYAIRENDGPAMMSYWRLANTLYADGNHKTYCTVATRKLSGEAIISFKIL